MCGITIEECLNCPRTECVLDAGAEYRSNGGKTAARKKDAAAEAAAEKKRQYQREYYWRVARERNRCADCGKPISSTSTRCRCCAMAKRRIDQAAARVLKSCTAN